MKDEVEKLVGDVFWVDEEGGWQTKELGYVSYQQIVTDLLALIDKAQVEAVRAALEGANQRLMTITTFNSPGGWDVMAKYLGEELDRLTRLEGGSHE